MRRAATMARCTKVKHGLSNKYDCPPGVPAFKEIFMRKILLATVATLGAGLAFTGAANAQPVKPVAPGTVLVHLNGYLQFGIDDSGSTYNTYLGNKLNAVSTNGDARLYAGVDAKTVTGIAYGAQIELRTTTSDANVGAGKATGTTGTAGTETFYIKRAYGYIGTKEDGYVRFGQGDSAFTLLQTGVIEAFGDGAQFNSDGGQSLVLPSKATPANFIYADASGLYATDKVVYLTPTIAGFSGAFGYEPNSNGLKEGYASDATASSTSAAQSSTTTASDIGSRRKNTFDVAAMYSLKSHGYLTKASVGYIHANPIGYNSTVALPAANNVDSLSVLEAGAQTTYAGLTIGANIKGGQTLDGYKFKPKGTRDGLTYIVGASYVVGPYVIGGSFYDAQTAGAYTPKSVDARTLSEYGAAAGANYVLDKDISLYIQYLYGHEHQYKALTGGKTNAQVQLIGTGATLKW